MPGKVLVTSRSFGQVSDEALDLLRDAGLEVAYLLPFDREAFEAALGETDALIIGAHPFLPGDFDRAPRLRIICKHGVGLDNIPLEAAKARGVMVTNAPGTNAEAVADFTMLLILASARNFIYSVTALKAGNVKPEIGVDVCGKKLGLLGFGAVGRRVAARARGFGMTVTACDPYVRKIPAGLEFVRMCDMETVLRESDFLSIHLPAMPETLNLVDATALSKMKPSARLINTARGGIVDETALLSAIKAGRLAGAALDVLAREPAPNDSPLLACPRVIVTNHVASYSREALNAISMICAENILGCLRGGLVRHRAV